MNKVRVGVIGVGYLGQFHAEKYANLPEVELVGLVDADPVRASQLSGKLKTQSFPDPAHLIGKVDAVSIVVPTVLHHSIAKQFLEQGVHVLIEKPMTVTLEQADELIDLATRNKLILQVGHIERFNPAFTAIKSLVGTPRYITAERAAPFTLRCTDVNVVLDLMIHDLDIVMDLAGSTPKEVSAAGISIITNEIDMATARIVFQNGCVADVSASRVSDEKKRLLRVFDEKAIYTSDYQTQKANVSRVKPGPGSQLVVEDISTDRRDTLEDEIRAFVKSVQGDVRTLVSGIEGRRALALARTITDNIEKGLTGFVPV
ncbi:MAG: Gfo/Idh/MocA family oxidoreductase [Nitrospirae bacterium]|nr:Gfo/Idh/MocA family oxidoreductase [Nitrospirota bacterium]